MSWTSRRVRVVFVLVVVTVLAAAVLPALRPLLTPAGRATDAALAGKDLYQAMALEALASLWFLAVGASLGSFLNVVVYRVPRRESIVWRPSYCPRCHSPIRLTDNIPLFGWVWLRGRCRDCWLPISMRYPLVELAFGLMVCGLAQRELISGGANLPLRPINRMAGATWVVWTPDWGLLAIFAYHVLLLILIAAWALMAWDGRQPPRRFAMFSVIAGAGLAVLMPWLHPLPPFDPVIWQAMVAPASATRTFAGLGALAGLGLGAGLGALVVGLSRRRSPHSPPEHAIAKPLREGEPQPEIRSAAQVVSEAPPAKPSASRTASESGAADEPQATSHEPPTQGADEASAHSIDATATAEAIRPLPQRRLEVRRLSATLSGATAGAFLGWQGMLTAALFTAILRAVARLPWTTALWPGTLLLLLVWRPLWARGWSPGARLTTSNVVAALVTLALIAAVAASGAAIRKLRRKPTPPVPKSA